MKTRLSLTVLLLASSFPSLLTGLAAAQDAETPPSPEAAEAATGKPVPAETLGLSKTSVFEVPEPSPVMENTSDPGEKPVLPRAYPGAPPRIPHAIADFLPITRSESLCIDCHLIEKKGEGDPTPIPASHKTDLRRTPGVVGEEVVGARWVCISCHVPKTGAEPLVANRLWEWRQGGAP